MAWWRCSLRCWLPAPIPNEPTLASLRKVQPDTTDVRVDNGLEKAVDGYRQFLQETPASELTPEAMRRLADLQLEKEYGVRGTTAIVVDRVPRPTACPTSSAAVADSAHGLAAPEAAKIAARAAGKSRRSHSRPPADIERQIEQRASRGARPSGPRRPPPPEASDGVESGPLESIQLYDKLLAEFPNYAYRDQVLYQKARAYDELGRPDDAMAVMEQLVNANPDSKLVDEVQFRRGESFFAQRKYRDAENAYQSVAAKGRRRSSTSPHFSSLAGRSTSRAAFEEALHRYFALIDHKVAKGYVLGAKHTAAEDRRVEDTFNVIALSFSNLGGPEVIGEYFARLATAPTRTTRIATWASSSCPSSGTRTPPRSTRTSSRSIRSMPRRRTSACASSASTRPAASRNSWWRQSASSRPTTG